MSQVIYNANLPGQQKLLRALQGDDGFTVTVEYHSQIRTHGRTQEGVINAMADLLQHEVDPDEIRRVFADATGRTGFQHVNDRAGESHKCGIGCVYSVPRTPETDNWFLFMSMEDLSVSAPTLAEAAIASREFVFGVYTDTDFLVAYIAGMIEMERHMGLMGD